MRKGFIDLQEKTTFLIFQYPAGAEREDIDFHKIKALHVLTSYLMNEYRKGE